jgi:hypothetical protein
MFQPHSILWHYLWVGPNVCLFALGVFFFFRHRRSFPAFTAFAILSSLGQLATYTVDVNSRFSANTFWVVDAASFGIDSVLKFIVIAEIFAHLLEPYPSIAKLGRVLIQSAGVLLTLAAAIAAAFTQKDGIFKIISGVHTLEQTVYLIECGVLVFIFGFASYFRLGWDRISFGISIGLSLSACAHLATKALVANAGLSDSAREALDFVNMASYHACVMVWGYFSLVPARRGQRSRSRTGDIPSQKHPIQIFPLPVANDHSEVLSKWNRELERLIHQ